MTDFCVHIFESQTGPDGWGFVPSVVFEGEADHTPLAGGSDGRPWIWGPTLEQAREQAVDYNKNLGVSEERALEIVASSFAAQDNNNEGAL